MSLLSIQKLVPSKLNRRCSSPQVERTSDCLDAVVERGVRLLLRLLDGSDKITVIPDEDGLVSALDKKCVQCDE
jgi:hypothetical protein